jgi:hypothetical protein
MPSENTARGPTRSVSRPTSGLASAIATRSGLAAAEKLARVHPRSATIGFRKTGEDVAAEAEPRLADEAGEHDACGGGMKVHRAGSYGVREHRHQGHDEAESPRPPCLTQIRPIGILRPTDRSVCRKRP